MNRNGKRESKNRLKLQKTGQRKNTEWYTESWRVKVNETKNKSYLNEASKSEKDMMQTDVETRGTKGNRGRESAVAKLTVNNQAKGQTGNRSLVVQNTNCGSLVS